jgi:hypothetical protein
MKAKTNFQIRYGGYREPTEAKERPIIKVKEPEQAWNSGETKKLHTAAQMGFEKKCEAAIAAGANSNAFTMGSTMQPKCTALHLAADGCHYKVLHCLVQAGGDPSLKDSAGCTVLKRLHQSKTWEDGAFDEHGNENFRYKHALNCSYLLTNTSLWRAAQVGQLEVVQYWLDTCGMSVDTPNPNGTGMTALHYAVCKCHIDLVRYLLERGADPSRRNTKRVNAHRFATDLLSQKRGEVAWADYEKLRVACCKNQITFVDTRCVYCRRNDLCADDGKTYPLGSCSACGKVFYAGDDEEGGAVIKSRIQLEREEVIRVRKATPDVQLIMDDWGDTLGIRAHTEEASRLTLGLEGMKKARDYHDMADMDQLVLLLADFDRCPTPDSGYAYRFYLKRQRNDAKGAAILEQQKWREANVRQLANEYARGTAVGDTKGMLCKTSDQRKAEENQRHVVTHAAFPERTHELAMRVHHARQTKPEGMVRQVRLPHGPWNAKQALTSLQQVNAMKATALLTELPVAAAPAEQQLAFTTSNQRHRRRFHGMRRDDGSMRQGNSRGVKGKNRRGGSGGGVGRKKAVKELAYTKQDFNPNSAHFESSLQMLTDYTHIKKRVNKKSTIEKQNHTWALNQTRT